MRWGTAVGAALAVLGGTLAVVYADEQASIKVLRGGALQLVIPDAGEDAALTLAPFGWRDEEYRKRATTFAELLAGGAPVSDAATANSIQAFALTPPDYVWNDGSSEVEAWLKAYGNPQRTCKVELGGAATAVTCEVVGKQLKIQGNPTSGDVALTLQNGTAPSEATLHYSIVPCEFQDRGLGMVAAGGARQRFALWSSDERCRRSSKPIMLALGDDRISLDPAENGEGVELISAPPTLKPGSASFDVLRADGTSMGTLKAQIVSPIEAGPLYVDFRLPPAHDPATAFGSASRVIYPDQGEAVAPAIVDPTWHFHPGQTEDEYVDYGLGVVGRAFAVVRLAAGLANREPSLPDTATVVNTVQLKVPSPIGPSSTRVWVALSAEPRQVASVSQIKFVDCVKDARIPQTLSSSGPRQMQRAPCVLPPSLRLSFTINQVTSQPVTARLALVDIRQESPPNVLLEEEVVIAAGAVRGAVPIPVSSLYATCDGADRELYDNGTYQIHDGSVSSGSCHLTFDPRRLQPADSIRHEHTWMRPDQLARLYGPQALVVSVERDGATAVRRIWKLSFDGRGCTPDIKKGDGEDGNAKDNDGKDCRLYTPSFTIPTPGADDKGTGPYRVTVVAATDPTDRTRSFGTPVSGLDGVEAVHPEQTFHLALRPRGLMGWPCLSGNDHLWRESHHPTEEQLWYWKRRDQFSANTGCYTMRVYATVDASLVGLRFPAAVSSLKTSQDATAVELLSPRLGILFSAEAFDYDAGADPLPLAPTLQFGFSMLKLETTSQPVQVSTLLGVAATFDLLHTESSQLGTKLAIGFYWEHGLWPLSGDYLTVTLGLNILSLLSGNKK